MENELKSYLEDKFKIIEGEFSKIESSIIRLFDKLDSVGKTTNDNTKDIEHIKEDIVGIKDAMDDKLKGFRLSQEGCQVSCEKFRNELQKETERYTDNSVVKGTLALKVWMLIAVLGSVGAVIISIIKKAIGG